MTASALIALKDVALNFGRVQALQGIHVSIEPGECVALVGANGSGKSSLLRLMQGLIAPTQGHVFQRDLQRQSFVFQKPWMLRASVKTNVALAAWLHGQSWNRAQEDALVALQQLDLADLLHRKARSLSGGQQQRLALARAIAPRPQVLLLDEPTASLAPESKHGVEQLLAQFKQQGMTMVFASHNLGQVKRLASRVIALQAGRVVWNGSCSGFFEIPQPALSLESAAANFSGDVQ